VKSPEIRTDFKLLAKSFRDYVRIKAIVSGSNIVYLKDDQIIEEDPTSLKKRVIKTVSPKTS